MTLGNDDNGTDGQTDRQTDGQTECNAICGPSYGGGPHNNTTLASHSHTVVDTGICQLSETLKRLKKIRRGQLN